MGAGSEGTRLPCRCSRLQPGSWLQLNQASIGASGFQAKAGELRQRRGGRARCQHDSAPLQAARSGRAPTSSLCLRLPSCGLWQAGPSFLGSRAPHSQGPI